MEISHCILNGSIFLVRRQILCTYNFSPSFFDHSIRNPFFSLLYFSAVPVHQVKIWRRHVVLFVVLGSWVKFLTKSRPLPEKSSEVIPGTNWLFRLRLHLVARRLRTLLPSPVTVTNRKNHCETEPQKITDSGLRHHPWNWPAKNPASNCPLSWSKIVNRRQVRCGNHEARLR